MATMIANKTTPPSTPKTVQEICIDLPGEKVQCWRSADNIKVILRNHRDVIFDLKLGAGKTYTVHTTDSDFYNARDKKLVYAKRNESVSFKDGERLHLWVSRGFKGSLVLKSEGKVMMHVEPNEWDKHRHDDEPKTKAPPIIIALDASAESKKSAMPPATAKPFVMQNPPAKPANQTHTDTTSSAANQVEQQDMHVIEINPKDKDLPQEVSDFITHGGEETAIDKNKILTRNWLWGQIVGTAAYYNDNSHWIKELWKEKFYLQKVVHRNAGTKFYIVFKGHAGLREYLTASRYAITNPKVLSIAGGAGSIKSMAHAAWSGVKDVAKGSAKGGVLAIFVTVSMDIAEWINGYFEIDPKTGKSKKDLFDLFVKIGIDLLKVFLGMVIGAIIIAIIVFLTAYLAGIAIVGYVLVGLTVVVVGLTGWKIERIDQEAGFSEKLTKKIRSTFDHLEQKMPKDYKGYGESLESMLKNWSL